MTEKRETIKLDLDGKTVEIVVARATTRMGIKRSLMIYAAIDAHDKQETAKDPIDEVAYVISYQTLPDLVAGTESVKGIDFPLTLEEVMELPEEFVSNWMDAIYKLNPHWDPANLVPKKVEEEQVKKMLT